MKKIHIVVVILFIAVVVSFLAYNNPFKQRDAARDVIKYAEVLVREKKPAPTESALLYAYVATAYYDTFVITNSTTTSALAARHIADRFFAPTSSIILNKEESIFVDTLLARMKTDGREKFAYNKPKGEYVWVDRDNNPKTPFTPNAGTWKRWNVGGVNFETSPPPVYLSKEYGDALKVVKETAEVRTSEQSAAVNFWGGVPGTNQPAGIWLDFFYETTKDERMSEKEFAYKQMIIAQTLSDAFMECWKVKYTYWTKRPDMTDPTINTAMPNPPFPSYVSGHSTISFAAATVLGYFFPKKKELYLENAEEAKNSRLWAGIHFPHDNEEGKSLGIKVGEEVIKNIRK